MNLKQALKRIDELERRVRELEARPQQVIHYHTHEASPVFPMPSPQPIAPNPWNPLTPPWIVTCGNSAN